MKTYFEHHGSSIQGENSYIPSESSFNDFKIIRHEQLVDGSFISTKIKTSWYLNHKGQLYYFLITHHGAIKSILKLNMDKSKCGNNGPGVYFEITKKTMNPQKLN